MHSPSYPPPAAVLLLSLGLVEGITRLCTTCAACCPVQAVRAARGYGNTCYIQEVCWARVYFDQWRGVPPPHALLACCYAALCVCCVDVVVMS